MKSTVKVILVLERPCQEMVRSGVVRILQQPLIGVIQCHELIIRPALIRVLLLGQTPIASGQAMFLEGMKRFYLDSEKLAGLLDAYGTGRQRSVRRSVMSVAIDEVLRKIIQEGAVSVFIVEKHNQIANKILVKVRRCF